MTDNNDCSPGHGDRCRNARTKKCRCACGGINHGGRMRDHEHGEAMPLTPFKVFEGVPDRKFRKLAPGADDDIRMWRDDAGNALVDIPQSLCHHSPTGFEWGYLGSGPAELALNILNLFIKPPAAWRLHQEYKTAVIARIPREGGVIRAEFVKQWIRDAWKRQDVQKSLNR